MGAKDRGSPWKADSHTCGPPLFCLASPIGVAECELDDSLRMLDLLGVLNLDGSIGAVSDTRCVVPSIRPKFEPNSKPEVLGYISRSVRSASECDDLGLAPSVIDERDEVDRMVTARFSCGTGGVTMFLLPLRLLDTERGGRVCGSGGTSGIEGFDSLEGFKSTSLGSSVVVSSSDSCPPSPTFDASAHFRSLSRPPV